MHSFYDLMENFKDGGGIPQRYKNMGFTHVGQKKQGDGQHKWKVLAKKGDKYKVVQGGYRGMQDFKQHHSEKRRKNFWNRMGGRNSAKATDPFSPLYWHKRFGTWEDGGELPEFQSLGSVPIYTSDKNDPRLRAYNDSLNQYLSGEMYANLINNFERDYEGATAISMNDLSKAKSAVLKKFPNVYSYSKSNKPRSQYPYYVALDNGQIIGPAITNLYTKPKQPVIYKKEPTLSHGVSYMDPISVSASTPGGAIIPRSTPNVELPSTVDMGKYKVDYFDPTEGTETNGGWHTKSFMTEQESQDYMKNRPMYGPSMTQRVEYANGGKLPKAQNGKKITIDGKEYDTSSDEYRNLYRFGPNNDGKGGVGYFNEKGQLVSNHSTLPAVTIFGKDKDTQEFYDSLSDADRYAYDQMIAKYGPVNVRKDKGTGIFSGTAGHYNPFSNRITINPNKSSRDIDTFVSELSHKVQFDKSGKFDVIGDWLFNDLPDYIKNKYYSVKDDFDIGDTEENMDNFYKSNVYEDPSTMEYEAHRIIEPKLKDEFSNYRYDDMMGTNYNKYRSGGQTRQSQKMKYANGGEYAFAGLPFHVYDIPGYADGGIHINPANKGKFTASARRAGMGVQEFARHVLANKDKYSSTQVKRANFARNATKFKHKEGGYLPMFQQDGLYEPEDWRSAYTEPVAQGATPVTPVTDDSNQMVQDDNGNWVYPEQIQADKIWMGQGVGSKGQPIVGTTNAQGEKIGGTGAQSTPSNQNQNNQQQANPTLMYDTFYSNPAAAMIVGLNKSFNYNIANADKEKRYREARLKAGSTDSAFGTTYNSYRQGRNEINTGVFAPGLMTPVQYAGMQAPEYYGFAGYTNARHWAQDGALVQKEPQGYTRLSAPVTPDYVKFTMPDAKGNFVDSKSVFNFDGGERKKESNSNTSVAGSDINFTHNNPLNIHWNKFTEGYGGTKGAPDAGGYVAKFDDLNTGIQVAKDLLFGSTYGNLTIEQARNRWVTGDPNEKTESATFIVKEMGSNKRLSDLTPAEKDKLIKLFAKWEGSSGYKAIKDRQLYQEGGEYELDDNEIQYILMNGGQIEYL